MDKNELLANLYALRARLSQISINKGDYEKIVEFENKKKEELVSLDNGIEESKHKINKLNNNISNINNEPLEGNALSSFNNKRQILLNKLEKSKKSNTNGYLSCFINFSLLILIVALAIGIGLFFYYKNLESNRIKLLEQFNNDTSQINNYSILVGYIYFILIVAVVVSLAGLLIYIIGVVIRIKYKYTTNKGRKNNIKIINKELNNLNKEEYIKNYINDRNREKVNQISNIEKEIKYHKANCEQYSKSKIKVSDELIKTENMLNLCLKETDNIYNTLVETYNYIDPRDFKNIDFIIYYIETNRADNIKEALQLLDQKQEFSDIKNLILKVSENISMTIKDNTTKLAGYLKESFNTLANNMTKQNELLLKSLDDYNNNVNNKINNLERQINYQQELSDALNKKISTSASDIAKDVNYMRTLAENAEIRRRNNL